MINTEFIYRVAPAGEGKTKWLVSCAEAEITKQSECAVPPVVFFTKVPRKYADFAENYFARTRKLFACRIATEVTEIQSEDTVLIEDWHTDSISGKDLIALRGIARKVYITVEGTLADTVDFPVIDPDQLSIFD